MLVSFHGAVKFGRGWSLAIIPYNNHSFLLLMTYSFKRFSDTTLLLKASQVEILAESSTKFSVVTLQLIEVWKEQVLDCGSPFTHWQKLGSFTERFQAAN